MKNISAFVFMSAFLLVADSSSSHEDGKNSWIGRIKFNGEFELYVTGFGGTSSGCISGSLPLSQQQDAKRRFDGKVVKVTGRAVSWPEQPMFAFLDRDGSRIVNNCGGDWVLFADDIEDHV